MFHNNLRRLTMSLTNYQKCRICEDFKIFDKYYAKLMFIVSKIIFSRNFCDIEIDGQIDSHDIFLLHEDKLHSQREHI